MRVHVLNGELLTHTYIQVTGADYKANYNTSTEATDVIIQYCMGANVQRGGLCPCVAVCCLWLVLYDCD